MKGLLKSLQPRATHGVALDGGSGHTPQLSRVRGAPRCVLRVLCSRAQRSPLQLLCRYAALTGSRRRRRPEGTSRVCGGRVCVYMGHAKHTLCGAYTACTWGGAEWAGPPAMILCTSMGSTFGWPRELWALCHVLCVLCLCVRGHTGMSTAPRAQHHRGRNCHRRTGYAAVRPVCHAIVQACVHV